MKNKKGFTLVELLGVVVILGIVFGLAVVTYVSTKANIDRSYYNTLEESLLTPGGDYFYYNKGEGPGIFGDTAKVKIKDLKDQGYIDTEIVDSKGDSCDLDNSYVAAYKDSIEKTNYYVCLVCDNYKTDNIACDDGRNRVDYSLGVKANKKQSKDVYNTDGKTWSNEDIVLTFETLNDMEEVELEDASEKSVGSCKLKETRGIKSCTIEVTKSGNYIAYAKGNTNTTRKEELNILIDKTAPTFEIENEGVDGKIEIVFENSNPEKIIKNRIYNIKDSESGIKNVEYSFVKDGEKDNYQQKGIVESFEVEKSIKAENYRLKIRVTNNAGIVTEKVLKYQLFKKIVDPTAEVYCNKLTYNGEEQTIVKEPGEGYTFEYTKRTNAGEHHIGIILKDGYSYSDGTLNRKELVCTIDYKDLTIKANNQTIAYGDTFNTGDISKVTATGLVGKDSLGGITLTPSTLSLTTNGKITPKDAKIVNGTTDVTSNYKIKYEDGNLIINKANASIGSCKTITYNGKSQELVNKAEGVTYSSTTGTDAKTYTITVTPDSNHKFSDNSTTKTLSCTIDKKAATITALDQTVSYGTAITNGTSKAKASNLVEGHTLSSVTLTASTTSVTTTGKITPKNAKIVNGTTDVTNNYNITYKDGNLTITPLTASIGDCYSRTYNGTSQTLISSGVGVNYNISSATNAGNYEIKATAKDGYVFPSGAITTKTCTISKRNLTITAKDQSIGYGSSISTSSSYVTTGTGELASGDSVYSVSLSQSTTSLTTNGTITPSNAVIKKGTSYSSTTVTDNYNITYRSGNLTITRAMPGFTLSEYSGSVCVGDTISFTARANVAGTFSVRTSQTTNKVTVSFSGTTSYQTTVTLRGVTVGNGMVYIDFTPNDSYYYYSDYWTYSVTVYERYSPNLRISPSSGSVAVNGTTSFTATADVYGTFDTSTSSGVSASLSTSSGTSTRVTVTGKTAGTGYVYVYFYPSSSSYETESRTYVATVTKQTASPGSCYSRTYNGLDQTLAGNGTGVYYTSNTGKNAGDYTVYAYPDEGYQFSDGSAYKTLSCKINKATPTLTLSSYSGSVDIGSKITIKASLSVTPTVANPIFQTISNDSGIAKTGTDYSNGPINITGVAQGSTTINVKFYVYGDLATNYNSVSKDFNVTVNEPIKIANKGSCYSRTYTGSPQILAGNGTGVRYENNSGTIAGQYTVKAYPNTGYQFSDGSSYQTLNCTINKATPTLTLTPSSGSVSVGSSTTFTAQSNVTGTFSASSSSSTYATVNYSSTASTSKSITVNGKAAGSASITVNFTPTNSNYTSTSRTYSVTVNSINICANFETNGATSIGNTSLCCDVTSGTTCKVNFPSITRSGYTIDGWAKSATSTTGTYTPYNLYSISKGDTYYAITHKSVTLTINANKSGASPSSLTTTGGIYNTSTSASVTIPSYEKSICYNLGASYRYYRISGLATSASGSPAYCSGGTINMSSDTTLYAKWVPEAKYVETDRSCVYGNGSAFLDTRVRYYLTENSVASSSTIENVAGGYRCTGYITNVRHKDINGTACTLCFGNETQFPRVTAGLTKYSVTDSCSLPTTCAVSRAISDLATIGTCNNLVYNGSNQTLVSGGENVTYSDNVATEAGGYQIEATATGNNTFADGSKTRILNCGIAKKAVTTNFKDDNAYAVGIDGENIELEVTNNNSTKIATMKDVNPNYTLRNTVIDNDDIKDNNIKTTYKVNYYLMNNDKVNYTLVKSNSYDAKVGDTITGEILEFSSYKNPKSITIEIINGENIINYYYERV